MRKLFALQRFSTLRWAPQSVRLPFGALVLRAFALYSADPCGAAIKALSISMLRKISENFLRSCGGSRGATEQRHKCNSTEGLTLDSLLLARKANELLLTFGTDGHEQPPADLQLLDELFRNDKGSSRNQNSIEGRVRFPAERAISVTEADVANAELLDALLRAGHER